MKCYRCNSWPCDCSDGCTIVCGDSLELRDVIDANVIVSDPPYGIGYDASKSTQKGIQKFDAIAGDDDLFNPIPWIGFDDCLLWGANYFCHAIPPRKIGAWYFWDKVKRNGLKVQIAEGEIAWHKNGTKTRAFRHLWSGAYRESESGKRSQHPNQKPVALLAWCIGLVDDGTILDPFMGSGTTLLAAKQLNRRCIGIEIEEKYCEIAANRLANEPKPLIAV